MIRIHDGRFEKEIIEYVNGNPKVTQIFKQKMAEKLSAAAQNQSQCFFIDQPD